MARDLNFENGGAWSTEPDGKGALPGSPAAAGIGVGSPRNASARHLEPAAYDTLSGCFSDGEIRIS